MAEEVGGSWAQPSCAQVLLMVLGILTVAAGIAYLFFGDSEQVPGGGTSQAPRTLENYSPGSAAPAVTNKDEPIADFKAAYDKKTGILSLDASKSTPGYKYSWYFGWSVGLNTGTSPSSEPMFQTEVAESLLSDSAKNWVMLTLINDKRQVVATNKQFLP